MPDSHLPRAANEVTIGEVYRLALRIDQRLDQITKDMVGRQEYESDQEGINRRLQELTDGLSAERRARERGDKEIVTEATNAKRWAIGVAISGAVGAVAIFGFLLRFWGVPA